MRMKIEPTAFSSSARTRGASSGPAFCCSFHCPRRYVTLGCLKWRWAPPYAPLAWEGLGAVFQQGVLDEMVQHEKAATFLDILKSFFSSDTRQSMKRRITTERLFTIYIARCGYTWLDESKWPQEWPISPITIIT